MLVTLPGARKRAGDAIAPQNAANDALFRRCAPYARGKEECPPAAAFRRSGAQGAAEGSPASRSPSSIADTDRSAFGSVFFCVGGEAAPSSRRAAELKFSRNAAVSRVFMTMRRRVIGGNDAAERPLAALCKNGVKSLKSGKKSVARRF